MSKIRLASVCLLAWSGLLRAEVATDGSLGPAGPLSGPDYRIDAKLGQQYGPNLFHSFSTFNLTAQESATFTGPESIAHIIGRVTGNSPSVIAGALRSEIPGSQLWLFNPAGLEFTGLSQVPGGVATAQALALSLKDGGIFRADKPEESVLTVAPPQVFFVDTTPAPLREEKFDEKTTYSQVGEEKLVIPFAVGREQAGRMLEEPALCGKTSALEVSRLTVSNYRGTPLSPDDWQPSGLLPAGFEPAPAN